MERHRIWSRPWAIALIAAALAFAAHAPAVQNGFVFDDHEEIEANRLLLEPFSLRGIFLSEYWGGGEVETRTGWYRPVPLLVQRIVHGLAGNDPRPYHWIVLLAHAAAAGLLGWVIASRFGLPRGGLAAGLLFAVHPVHAEAVSTGYGLKEVLAGLLSLAAFAVFSGWREDAPRARLLRLGVSGLLFFLAILSKESAAPVAAPLVAWDLLREHQDAQGGARLRRNLRATLFHGAFFGAVLAAAVSMRIPAVGGIVSQVPLSPLTNPIVGLAQPERFAMALRIVFLYARMLVWPVAFCVSYAAGAVAVPASIFTDEVLIGGALLLLLAAAIVRAPVLRSPTGVGAVWAGATYLLASNLILPFSTMMSERFLYLPSIGLAMMLAVPAERLLAWRSAHPTRSAPAALQERLLSRRGVLVSRAAAVSLAAVVVVLAIVSFRRTPVYGDDRALTEACCRWYPDGVVARLAAASRLTEEGRYDEAETALARLEADHPGLPSLDEHLAVNAYNRGHKEEAAVHYARASDHRLAAAGTRLAYAELLVEQQGKDEAIRQLSRALRDARGDYRDLARARELRGVLLMERGATTQGLADLRLACAINPSLAPAWLDLAGALERLGDERGAEDAHGRAVALRPADPATLRAGGRFLLARRRGEEAAALLERACAAVPASSACLSDLGTAWVQARRLDRARAVFDRILARDPAHLVALATLGSIEESEGRPREAIDLYARYLAAATGEDPLTAQVRARRDRLSVSFDRLRSAP